jgi:hypothetical protein
LSRLSERFATSVWKAFRVTACGSQCCNQYSCYVLRVREVTSDGRSLYTSENGAASNIWQRARNVMFSSQHQDKRFSITFPLSRIHPRSKNDGKIDFANEHWDSRQSREYCNTAFVCGVYNILHQHLFSALHHRTVLVHVPPSRPFRDDDCQSRCARDDTASHTPTAG